MALQVTGGVGCCCPRPLPGSGGRRLAQAAAAALCRPPRAVASGTTTVVEEDEGKVRLGGSSVAVTKLGIGAWSWGDTTYWNDSEWDGTYVGIHLRPVARSCVSCSRSHSCSGVRTSTTFPEILVIIWAAPGVCPYIPWNTMI